MILALWLESVHQIRWISTRQAAFRSKQLIIGRYMMREISQSMLAVMTILLLIYVSNHFVRLLSAADEGVLANETIFTLLVLKVISALVILLPLGLFLAVLLALGRLYKDNEMVALAACGVSPREVIRAVLVISILCAMLVAWISLHIAPWAEERAYQIRDVHSARAGLTGLVSGRFITPKSIDGVLYAEQIDAEAQTMRNIFIQGSVPGQSSRQLILRAATGYQQVDEQSGDLFLVMENGYRYEGTPGERDFYAIKYRKHAVRISEQQIHPAYRKHRALPSLRLFGSIATTDRAELQWRLSMPLAAILLGLLAVPLSKTAPRQGKYARLFVAILVYVVYSNLLGVSQSWLEQGAIPAWLGMWWVHGLLLILTWVLLAQQYSHAWLMNALFRRSDLKSGLKHEYP